MRYLVDFVNSATDEQIDQYLASVNATVIKVFKNFDKVYHIESPTEPHHTEIVEFITADDNNEIQLLSTIVVADKNFGKIMDDGSVPPLSFPHDEQNWWKAFTFMSNDFSDVVTNTNRRGAGINVYVLDSGIDISHPEFQDADVHNLWSFTGDFTDTRGHGTSIASVIVGKTCGVTNATVKSVKIFDKNIATKQSDILYALDVIVDDFINSPSEHAIVNASWAISKNEYIEDKIRSMLRAGVFFVVSAGNNGVPINDVTPAGMPEVLTVGSYNNNLVPSDFSNYTGSGISVTAGQTNHGALDGWAPGEQIWTAGLNGTYHYVAGTSIAAAIHSATIAYNLTVGYNEPILDDDLLGHYHAYGMMRKGMLDLSDPKYTDSVNKISTIADQFSEEYFMNAPIYYKYRIFSGKKASLNLFNPRRIKTLEIVGDLPPTFSVTSTGKLYGLAPEVSNDQGFEKKLIPMIVTYDDDTVESFDFTMYIVSSEFYNTDEPTGNPELDIILNEGFNCQFGPGCALRPGQDSCFPECGAFQSCSTGLCDPKEPLYNCECVG